eukprot:955934-Amphidinium_carterae.1
MKCDNEISTVALRYNVRAACLDFEILEESPPVGDHPANGLAEAGVREIKRQMRAIRTSSEEALGARIPDDHPAPAWLPRFAADVINRYRLGTDGFTAEQRRTGRRWRKPCFQFLEKVFVKIVGEQGPSTYTTRFHEG